MMAILEVFRGKNITVYQCGEAVENTAYLMANGRLENV